MHLKAVIALMALTASTLAWSQADSFGPKEDKFLFQLQCSGTLKQKSKKPQASNILISVYECRKLSCLMSYARVDRASHIRSGLNLSFQSTDYTYSFGTSDLDGTLDIEVNRETGELLAARRYLNPGQAPVEWRMTCTKSETAAAPDVKL